MSSARVIRLAAALVGHAAALAGQAPASRKPTIYTVAYSHLDTQWLWEYTHTIAEYLPATMRDNFALIERYPKYGFNFSGANRYRMMKEYYPADYARVRQLVAEGRWFPAGSSVEEGDVNLPSAEAVLRQILYGNEFFRDELGTASLEFLLPDSFGFPWSLPSLLAHAGLRGFSTAKLTWGSSVPDQPTTPTGMAGKGVPFNVGRWIGPDGRGIVAALNPGDYIKHLTFDLSRQGAIDSSVTPPRPWIARLRENAVKLGVPADYLYVGTGDIGGAPNEGTVWWLEKAIENPAPAIRVLGGGADRFFRELTAAEIARLRSYAGEMELTNHSAGSLTSQADHKRTMRRNEVLADGAEKAAVGAELLGALEYPRARLASAWNLMLAGHFHDIAAGTATPAAYSFSSNDASIASNQLAQVITDRSEAIAAQLDTRGAGVPLVVYNSLDRDREDVVEALLDFPDGAPTAVTVVGPDGVPVPAQVEPQSARAAKVVFVAKVPSVGYAVYHVRAGGAPGWSQLSVTTRSVENERYRVRLDERGDIASLFDKRLGRELLRAPIRLALRPHTPADFPAWNMDWADQIERPKAYVGDEGAVRFTVTERGPARVALTVERGIDSSRFVQTVRLAAGDGGHRVEIRQVIDWRQRAAALKAMLPFTAANDRATYNLQVGTISRGTRTPRKFEVGTQQWIDLSDRSGRYGVTVLTGDQHGSDKPDAHTIGLTLLLTPGLSKAGRLYPQQATQDWGRHEITFGLAAHAGDWRRGDADWQAYRLDTPLRVFRTASHDGPLGRTCSLLRTNTSRVRVMAFKKAEETDQSVVRIVELDGRRRPNVRLSFLAPVTSARAVDGQEHPVDRDAAVDAGSLVTTLRPFEIRSFAVTFGPPPARRDPRGSEPVQLPFDRQVASTDGSRSAEGFDDEGRSLPAELLPARIRFAGVTFELGPTDGATKNAVTATGQTIDLPAGAHDRLYLLAASAAGDREVTFRIGDQSVSRTIQDWSGFIGQGDTRRWKRIELPPEEAAEWSQLATQARAQFEAEMAEVRAVGGDTVMARRGVDRSNRLLDRHLASLALAYDGITPGFVKRSPIAWFASHRHDRAGANEPYAYSYLFGISIDLPPGAATIGLPDDPRIRILALTVAKADPALVPVEPLDHPLARDSVVER